MATASTQNVLVIPAEDGIRQRLADELSEVETRFARELTSDLPCVNQLVRHIERYRGKMLRPMLVLVSGMAASAHRSRAVGPMTDAQRVVATVVEMVHMATLVHDDILDESAVRRRGSTINFLHGNETAVMLGDYLISHAYHLCSSLASQTASRLLASATNVVCEGELLQLANRQNWDLDETTYYDIIRRKTASLCGMSCRLGAMFSDDTAGAALADRFAVYGENVGLAFQVVDDLLDLTGDEDTVGKTLGLDLKKGKLTLPLIHHLSLQDARRKAEFINLIKSDAPASQGSIREMIVASGSVEYGMRRAQRFIAEARAALSPLGESPAKSLLLEMADVVLTRRF